MKQASDRRSETLASNAKTAESERSTPTRRKSTHVSSDSIDQATKKRRQAAARRRRSPWKSDASRASVERKARASRPTQARTAGIGTEASHPWMRPATSPEARTSALPRRAPASLRRSRGRPRGGHRRARPGGRSPRRSWRGGRSTRRSQRSTFAPRPRPPPRRTASTLAATPARATRRRAFPPGASRRRRRTASARK